MAQTHDIEDVLSSIRRLVANEAGPAAKPQVPDATNRPEGPTLVLSDSHRVTEPEDPFQMIRSLAQEERDGRDAEHLTDALPEDVTAITTDLSDAVPGAPIWDDAPTAETDELAQDGGQSEDAHGDRVLDAVMTPASEQEETVESHASVADPQDRDEAGTADIPTDYTEDTDYDAAPAAPADDVIAFQHRASANTEPEGRTASGLADLSASVAGDEALRDLIAEIVRQELAGDLGERITRNVRKLVRREIRQMLASDEFD